ncbi:MAG: MerR family transcriptional regulator [Gemmiger sp.]|nr:MerR family transcriptional regulator [Gemmiger sp.]
MNNTKQQTEYTVQALAKLSGVSSRTLRYYDGLGLLSPARLAENGYRLYGTAEVDRLQQILFYREMGVPLKTIAQLLDAPGYDRAAALRGHLKALQAEQARLAVLAQNLAATLHTLEGEQTMQDTEKFKGFKAQMLQQNEEKYGSELRQKYGEATVNATNAKVAGMSEQAWQKAEALRTTLEAELKALAPTADPAGEAAQALCALHRQWLCCYWADGMYTRQAHAALGQGYLADERFKAYYDAIVPGGTAFLAAALAVYANTECPE